MIVTGLVALVIGRRLGICEKTFKTHLLASTIQQAALRSMANTIEGGMSEIMRNILGEPVLGLPGDPRTDKDVPWKDVPRS